MRLVNYNYINNDSLKEFIVVNNILNSDKILLQIFSSNQESKLVYQVRDELKNILPNASIIATSTAGVISDGNFHDDVLTISFSIFDSSHTKSVGYTNLSIDNIIDNLKKNIISDETKLLVIFANTFSFDSSSFLEKLTKNFPNIAIAGGNAGDDYNFEKCEVFTKDEENCDVVIASIESKNLTIQTKYLLNWQTIGRNMKVTKSDGAKVYEIDNKSVIDVYEYYLGKDVVDELLVYGMEFPIIFKDEGVDIARALVAYDAEEGSMTFAGNVPQGVDVKFGYANVEHIERQNSEILDKDFQYKNEAIYIYSCGARRQTLGAFLNEELTSINEIASITGFITYGEFFHDTDSCHNNLLNITTTYVVLNEEEDNKKLEVTKKLIQKDKRDITLKALTTLVSRTSEELDENIYYLEQFKNAVNEASIFSITDARGVITHANKNFQDISGYKEEELLGKPHSIIRHPDMSSEVFREMWKTIKSGKIWRGNVKNRNKKGKAYHLVSEIIPIFYKDGGFREYIGIRTDVTELEEYKNILKDELGEANKTLEENVNYIKQYEDAIDSTIAIVKTDTNNVIKYANEKLCQLSGYSLDELVGRDCKIIRDDLYNKSYTSKKFNKELNNKKVIDVVLNTYTKGNQKYITDTLIYPILDIKSNVVEHLQIMHDITDVVKLNNEIVDTQKEVVFTMGAIGETRSKETGLHVKRVAEYSYLLAIHYGLDEEIANLLRQASPMHDIGKVGIPDNILNKPGKLTSEEFEIMKTHAELGYEMLKHSKREILQASAVVAHSHHEKWDGSGYPAGLKGEEINIFGRITAVSDVFDALGHDRCYKKAWKLEDILELFKEQRGKHFDPELIDIFFDKLDEFLAIQKILEDDVF